MAGEHLRTIAIAGNGVAAWMSAAVLAHALKDRCTIRVLETGDVMAAPEVGTLPHLRELHAILGLDEAEMMRAAGATFRLGGMFRDWGRVGDSYFHPFGDTGASLESVSFRHHWLKAKALGSAMPFADYSLSATAARLGNFAPPSSDRRSVLSTLEYAYHLDTGLYTEFLRTNALARGVQRDVGEIADVARSDDGSISALLLANGTRIEADLFIDATGDARLIEGTLGSGFEDWSEWLPADRMTFASREHAPELPPFSESQAHGCSWRWNIPLQRRIGAGLVYCSRYLSDDEAGAALGGQPDARVVKFASGRRRELWKANVVAIGAAACTLEPLEAVGIHIIQTGLMRLLALLPDREIAESERKEYNRLMASETERIRDFLIAHYAATARGDSDFWNYCRTMELPETLDRKMRLFRSRGRVVLFDEETFGEHDWTALFIGQNVIPERYDPLADAADAAHIQSQMQRMRSVIKQGADSMPRHGAYLEKYLRVGGR